jgi:hypothetical protein
VLGACGGSNDDTPRTQAAASPGRAAAAPAAVPPPSGAMALPDGPWRDLARRLVAARTLDTAVEVTREVLARGGIATFDGTRVLVAPVGPAGPFQATPLETIHLAMEARKRATAGRLAAADLAQMLEGFGWRFRAGRDDGGGNASAHARGDVSDPEALREAELAERAAQQARERADGDRMEGPSSPGARRGRRVSMPRSRRCGRRPRRGSVRARRTPGPRPARRPRPKPG